MKILFVCTGNTCRSPMAQGLMNIHAAKAHLPVVACSAGLMADAGSKVSINSVQALKKYKADISTHVATQLTATMADEADLILTMTSSHCEFLKTNMPHNKNKIFSLAQYTATNDISDPYGQSLEVYEKCAEQINNAVLILCERLKSK